MEASAVTPDPSREDAAPLVRLSGISKSFPGVRALDGVALELFAGETHMLLGENGAGKSTLVKVLAGAHAPDPGGEIVIGGRRAAIDSPTRARALGISVIHQELKLVPVLSAAQNLFLGREPRGRFGQILDRRLREAARAALARLGVDLDVDLPVERLSVAQQQMVEIAAAMLADCRVLVLDEPTSALSPKEVGRLGEALEALRAAGAAILYVTHRFEEVFAFGSRATVLRDGRRVASMPLAETSRGELVRLMVGREVTESFPRRVHPVGEARLAVERLSSPAGPRDVSLEVRRGEVVGIAGLMGSGRTETLRAIFGADPRAGGRVAVDGRPLPLGSVRAAIESGIALVPEDRKTQGLVLGMGIDHNATLAALRALCRRLLGIRRAEEAAAVDGLIHRLRVRARSRRQPALTLSGGNQQKVVLAKWLQAGAKVFLFDEPTRGIDVGARAEVYGLINELAAGGAAVLLVSSDLPELLGLSDRVLVLCEGRVAGELSAAEATPEKVLDLATAHARRVAAPREAS